MARPLYHGSTSPDPISRFRERSVSVNSTTFGDVQVERAGIFLSDSPEFAGQYGDHVHAYATRISNIADLDVGWATGTNDVRARFIESLDAFEERELWVSARYAREPWQMFDGEVGRRFVAWLVEQGYDAARFSESLPSDEGGVQGRTTVVFDPDNVRPASEVPWVVYHGTDVEEEFAAFDPAMIGTATDAGYLGEGFYFSTDLNVGRSSARTLEAAITLTNPLRISCDFRTDKRLVVRNALGLPSDASAAQVTKAAAIAGYDGIVLDYAPAGYHHFEVVAFDARQMRILRQSVEVPHRKLGIGGR